MNEKEYIDTDIALTKKLAKDKQIVNQLYGMKFTIRNSKYNPYLRPLIREVLTEIYFTLIRSRRFKDKDIYTEEYRLSQMLQHESVGLLKSLAILNLISRDTYTFILKDIETFDLSKLEEYIYKNFK